jgi:hypothetical protein
MMEQLAEIQELFEEEGIDPATVEVVHSDNAARCAKNWGFASPVVAGKQVNMSSGTENPVTDRLVYFFDGRFNHHEQTYTPAIVQEYS